MLSLKPLAITEHQERFLTKLVENFSFEVILRKVVKEGVVIEKDGKKRYLEWTIDGLLLNDEPLLPGPWISASERAKKRKREDQSDLDGTFWNTSSRREPVIREVPLEKQMTLEMALLEIASLQKKVNLSFFVFSFTQLIQKI